MFRKNLKVRLRNLWLKSKAWDLKSMAWKLKIRAWKLRIKAWIQKSMTCSLKLMAWNLRIKTMMQKSWIWREKINSKRKNLSRTFRFCKIFIESQKKITEWPAVSLSRILVIVQMTESSRAKTTPEGCVRNLNGICQPSMVGTAELSELIHFRSQNRIRTVKHPCEPKWADHFYSTFILILNILIKN